MNEVAAIALDLGSTSIKAGLLLQDGSLGEVVSLLVPEIIHTGVHYESDALAYAESAEKVLARCRAQTTSLTLGLCSQRSSFLIWDAGSGQPLTPLISWQDTRGAASCEALRDSEQLICQLSGLRLTPYYFAPKLKVLLQEFPQWRELLDNGKYLVGTLDTFLIWRWTSGKYFVTDASMAARTLLMDIRQQQWSVQLCELFGISPGILPQIKSSSGLAIQLDNGLILNASLGDQSAAFVSSVGDDRNTALVNLGTGGFVLCDFSKQEVFNQENNLNGYLRTLLFQDGAARAHIAIEGTLNSIAAALANFPVAECRNEDFATSGIFCVSEPSGLGAPYLRSDVGLKFSDSIEHLTRHQVATLLLEGIIFRVARILEDFHRESPIGLVYLSGGLSELPCLQQGIAQCVPMNVCRLQQKDASLLGAGLLAAGMLNSSRVIQPVILAERTGRLLAKYQKWKIWLDDLLSSPSL